MAKTIICLVLTAVFAFLSLSSYADTDAPRMRQWMAYYEEYQALKTLEDRSDDAKMTLLNKLRTMYPEKAAIYETKFKEEFGDLEAKAKAEKEKAAADERAQAEVEAHRRELAAEKARLEKEREQLRQQQAQQNKQTQKNSNTNGNRR